jgi:hypothetical protein
MSDFVWLFSIKVNCYKWIDSCEANFYVREKLVTFGTFFAELWEVEYGTGIIEYRNDIKSIKNVPAWPKGSTRT